MIAFAQRTDRSIEDLAESIAFVANVTVTKEEFEERLGSVEKRIGLVEKSMATKTDLAAAEHRIKSYIDDKVVAGHVMPKLRAEDHKVNQVIDSLEAASVYSTAEAEYLKQQGPFPRAV